MTTIPIHADPVDQLLAIGLKDLWYPICPSSFIKEKPVSLRRLGRKLALWRDPAGALHALEDRCPHRGAPLSQGVNLGDFVTQPAEARLIDEPVSLWPRDPPIRYRAKIPTSWLEITLREGKNRQVRRMTAKVGFPTLRLIRSSVGHVSVEGLPLGTWREIDPDAPWSGR